MNQEKLELLVEQIVENEFVKNEEMIARDLSLRLDWEDGWEKTLGQAVVNAVKVSTKLSVKIILDRLLQTGLFHLSVSETPPDLTVLKGGLTPESPDGQSPK